MDADGPIIIPVHQFFEQYEKCTRSDVMMQKVKWLHDTYECFSEGIDSSKPKWHKIHRKPVEKPKIIKKELSTESIAKREFLGSMNKLSPKNKDSVFKTILATHRSEYASLYVGIVWDFMLRAPDYQPLYIDLLTTLCSTNDDIGKEIHKLHQVYMNERLWFPPDSIMEESSEYDDFCEYVKWKKRAVAAIRGWMTLIRGNLLSISYQTPLLLTIFDVCDELMFSDPSKKLEAVLDQMLELITYIDHVPSKVVQRIEDWGKIAQDMMPIIRFKILDIRDQINEKNDR